MNELALLIDMGNTRLKWVWAQGENIIESTHGRGQLDDFLGRCKAPSDDQADRILVSSVADSDSSSRVMMACEDRFGTPAVRLESTRSLAGIVNGYENPSTLGVDRWLAIVGAAHAYTLPVVIMDLGTATTLDAVDAQGRHTGGLILPGPELMLRALADATAMQVPLNFDEQGLKPAKPAMPGVGPATETASAIVEGVYAAQIGALNQFLRHVAADQISEPTLVLTGGAAGGILKRLENSPVFDPWLVFKGMLHHQE
jgi:type III pantothenate kinase